MNIILRIEKNIVIAVIRTRNIDKKKKKLNHSYDLKKSKKNFFSSMIDVEKKFLYLSKFKRKRFLLMFFKYLLINFIYRHDIIIFDVFFFMLQL